jgi:hypothetical protein
LGELAIIDQSADRWKLWPSVGWDSDVAFPGTLPSLPLTANIQKSKLGGYLADDVKEKGRTVGDTYALGKQLGKWATLLPIAEQLDDKTAAAELTRRIKAALENFFTATDASGALKTAKDGVFYYDKNWGTLIGYPRASAPTIRSTITTSTTATSSARRRKLRGANRRGRRIGAAW